MKDKYIVFKIEDLISAVSNDGNHSYENYTIKQALESVQKYYQSQNKPEKEFLVVEDNSNIYSETMDKLLKEDAKVFWIEEESEIYVGKDLETILNYFWAEKEIDEILKNKYYGEVFREHKVKVDGENYYVSIQELIPLNWEKQPEQLTTSYS